jgi:hypothetical protein
MDTQVLQAISFIAGIVLTAVALLILTIVIDKREKRNRKLNKN